MSSLLFAVRDLRVPAAFAPAVVLVLRPRAARTSRPAQSTMLAEVKA
ncbi:hypothetical protein [Streptomyces sp. NPDC029674]